MLAKRSLLIALLTTSLKAAEPSPLVSRRSPSEPVCKESEYVCGPPNSLSHGTIQQCVRGEYVVIANCDTEGSTACKMINSAPFCVADDGTPSKSSKIADDVQQLAKGEGPAPVDPPGQKLLSDQPRAVKGQPLLVIDSTLLTADDEASDEKTRCKGEAYTCGPLSSDGFGTIVQCSGGFLEQISTCRQNGQNACKVINKAPFCVEGEGKSGIYMKFKKVTTPKPKETTATKASPFTTAAAAIPSPKSIEPSPVPSPEPASAPIPPPPSPSSPQPPSSNVDEPYARQGLNKCQYDIILKITSVFETSKQTHSYEMCGNINDGQGISAGFIQFTTSSGSAYKVVDTYLSSTTKKDSNPPLANFVGSLEQAARAGNGGQVNGYGNVNGLSGFCDAWRHAATTDFEAFKDAQVKVQQDLYLSPNKPVVDSLGLKTALGVGLVFDTGIQLGLSAVTAIARNAGPTPKDGVDEATYINSFLDAKMNHLSNMGGAYAQTGYRINSYRHVLRSGNLNFEGGRIEALDNSGGRMPVQCD
ncbi:hypothetical protein HDU67_002248 [Dinochytrium kinnereticum]|nr:hypothetical protein HDU67_002248 [Dinochytrium kinnereticum]